MAGIYTDTPNNFSRIQQYVITDKQTAARELVLAKRCYFYDACTFRWHMALADPECLFTYIKATDGIVVVTRSIIMELCSSNGSLLPEHIEYFRKMHQKNITILVIFEEDLFNALSLYTSSTEHINRFLSTAVKHTKLQTGVVSEVLSANSVLHRQILSSDSCSERSLFQRFFSEVRNSKSPGDNLGEEVTLICIHMLTNIPETVSYKYIFLTDDKGAVAAADIVMENTKKHIGQKCVATFTTPRLVQQLWDRRILTQKRELLEILRQGNNSHLIRVVCSREYELHETDCLFSADDLAENIVNENGFHVSI